MPINVFGNSANNSDNKIGTRLFVKKPYLRTNYIESNSEEDIALKNRYRIRKLHDPNSIREACSKSYAENLFNDLIILRSTAHLKLNDRNISNARFIQVNQLPQTDSHLTAKLYVDNAIDEISVVQNSQDNDFNNNNVTNIISITLKKQAENDNEVSTKAYVDQFHQKNERSRRVLGIYFYDESGDLVKNNQDKAFNDNKLTNIDSITVNRIPTSDNEISNKKFIDEELSNKTIVRFNQTLQNYLKVSVGNDVYNLTKCDKVQLTEITTIKYPNSGGYLRHNWNIKCNDKKGAGKIQSCKKSIKTNSSTSDSGATNLPPIGESFMYMETSCNNHGNNAFVSCERTDIIEITNIIFYYNRYSVLTDNNLKNMGCFRIQWLLEDNTWSPSYNIPEHDRYSDTSSEWTLVSLNFTEENYGINFIYDQLDTTHADMCFSNITITHSVY